MSDRFNISDGKDSPETLPDFIEPDVKKVLKKRLKSFGNDEGKGFLNEIGDACLIMKVKVEKDKSGCWNLCYFPKDLPQQIPSDIVQPVLEDIFESKEYAQFIVQGKESLSIRELQAYHEFEKEFYNKKVSTTNIDPLEVTLLISPNLRAPIANAVLYAKQDKVITPLQGNDMKRLKNKTYWRVATKYFVLGVEKACGSNNVRYDLVKRCVDEWDNALQKYANAFKRIK